MLLIVLIFIYITVLSLSVDISISSVSGHEFPPALNFFNQKRNRKFNRFESLLISTRGGENGGAVVNLSSIEKFESIVNDPKNEDKVGAMHLYFIIYFLSPAVVGRIRFLCSMVWTV